MRSRMRPSAACTSGSVTMWEGDGSRARGARQGEQVDGSRGARRARQVGRRGAAAVRTPGARSVLDEAPRELHAGPDAQLVEDRLQVALDGLRRDPEPLRDLAGAQAVRDEQGDLPFTL